MSDADLPRSFRGKIVTIFGSSKPVEGDKDYEDAEILGKKLSSAGISVCTGGYAGIMEAVSRGASQSDVKIIGVTSAAFSPTPNRFVNVQVHTVSLFERLQKLVEIGDAYIVLKGGTGTLAELSIVWELINKELVKRKPIVIAGGFWKPVVDLISNSTDEGRIAGNAGFISTVADASQAADVIIASFSTEEPPAK